MLVGLSQPGYQHTTSPTGCSPGGSGRQYQHHDRSWNIRAVTDEAGTVLERYLYDPFYKRFVFDGNTVLPVSAIDQSYCYTNQRYDRETQLWYFKHRHLVLWPRRDGQLSEFMCWLTVAGVLLIHYDRYAD